MKSFCLFLIFTIVTLSANSQISSKIGWFANETSGLYGLKSSDGTIIWPAQFKTLRQVWDGDNNTYPRNYFWQGEKNGRFGLIDPSGELMLPFNYSQFKIYTKAITTADDSAAYLFSLEGELILKLKGYSGITPAEKGYMVERDKKIGFYNLELNELIAPEYDNLSFCQIRERSEVNNEVFSNRFILVERDQEKAVFDIDQSKWVVPWTEDHIYPKYVAGQPESDAIFILSNMNSPNSRVFNSCGVEVLVYTDPFRTRIDLIPLNPQGTKSHQFAYLERDSKMKVLNLKTREYSKDYPEIFPLRGYCVFFEEKKWGLIDTNFIETKRFSYPKYEVPSQYDLSEYGQFDIASDHFSRLFQPRYNEEVDSVLIMRKEIKLSKEDKYPVERFGLINFRTGKRIKPQYQQIQHRKYDNQSLYWGINYANEQNKYTSDFQNLDIYDAEMKLIGQIETGFDLEFSYYYKSNGIIIEQYPYFGLITPKGEIIIPIIYQKCQRANFRTPNTESMVGSVYIVENDLFASVFDDIGKEIIPAKYHKIYSNGKTLQALGIDDLYDIYDFQGNLLLDSVKYITQKPLTDEFGSCFDERNRKRNAPIDHNCSYYISGDQLYRFFEGEIQILDENFFKFKEKYCYFNKWVLIDQRGKLITKSPSIPMKMYDFERRKPYECSILLDEYPVKKN